MHRARPFSSSVNFEGKIAEVELARIAPGGAKASSRANISRFIATSSGVFSCTCSAPASASSSVTATRIRARISAGADPFKQIMLGEVGQPGLRYR